MDELRQSNWTALRRDGIRQLISDQPQLRTTAMTVPHYMNEHQSDIRAIKPGWYGVENNGKLSKGRTEGGKQR